MAFIVTETQDRTGWHGVHSTHETLVDAVFAVGKVVGYQELWISEVADYEPDAYTLTVTVEGVEEPLFTAHTKY